MANQQINLALKTGYAADGVGTVQGLKRIPFMDVGSSWVNQNVNGRTLTYDGYEFKTDWNGSTNYLRVRAQDIFSTYETQGLFLDTTDTIGKDRSLIIQYMNSNANLFPPNVIGYTGLWKNVRRDFHPRLDMVVFHYMDKYGTPNYSFKVDRPLYDHSETQHTWRYEATGQHDSGVAWRIGYTIDPSRYSDIFARNKYLYGMTMQIKYRTGAGQHTCDGRFWHFKPIVAKSSSASMIPTLSEEAAVLNSGERLIIPADGNTWPVSGDMKLT